MNSKHIGAGIIAIIVIILLVILIPGRSSTDSTTPLNNDDVEGFFPQEITAVHEFSKGTHMVRGEIDLPTPCHTLTHEVLVAESYPEQATISFDTEIDDQVVCAQVITPTSFEISFDASADATIQTRFNNRKVPLTFVSPNENTEE